MKFNRSIVLTLAITFAAPALMMMAPPAYAQDAASAGAPAVFEVVAVPSVVADGQSAVTMRVVALNSGGSPISGLKPKLSCSVGEVEGWSEVSSGLYEFQYTPPKLAEATEVSVSIKAKLPTKATVEADYSFTAGGSLGAELSASFNPESLTLGKSDEATVSIKGALAKGDVLFETSTGELTNLTNMGGGKFSARYEAPKVNFPHVAIVTLGSAEAPLQTWGYGVLPLNGNVNYPVEAAPNSSVLLRIGDSEFGPVKASPEGSASVPIVVPPGVAQATVVSVMDGETKEEPIDLRVPETKRMAGFPLPANVPGDSSYEVPVRVVVLTAGGDPDTNAEVSISSKWGDISDVTHEGSGMYTAMWTPPDTDEKTEVEIVAKVGEGKVQRHVLKTTLLPRRATGIAMESSEGEGGVSKLLVTAVGTNGEVVKLDGIDVEIEGGQLRGLPMPSEEGGQQIEFRPEGSSHTVQVIGTAAVSENPVRHVVVLPAKNRIDADSASKTDLVLVTTDAFGYPVAGVSVTLSSEGGDAKLPEKIKTDENGIARVQLTAGGSDALIRVRATAGYAQGAASVLQGVDGAEVNPGYSTSASDSAVLGSWLGVFGSMHVSKDGAEVAVAAAPVPAAEPEGAPPPPEVEVGDPEGETASFDVSVYPDEAWAGGTVTLRVIPKSEDGKALPEKSLDVLTNGAEVGDTVETSGVYDTTLIINEDAEGEAKVTVAAPSGLMKMVKIPIGEAPAVADSGSAWGAVEDTDEDASADADDSSEEEAEEPKAEKPPKEPKASGEHRWLRAQASGVGMLYNYAQTPGDQPGPLINSTLEVPGGDGGAAQAAGFEVGARAWLPGLSYVGVVSHLRASTYGIQLPMFSDPAVDWLYDAELSVAGRYPFDVGSDQYWAGVKAGFHYDDLMIFEGCIDEGCTISYNPVTIPGGVVGAEMGAELGSLHFIAGYGMGLAGFTRPYSNMVDVDVGAEIVDHVFIDLGFSWVDRNVILEGAESGLERGTLNDEQLVFKLGAGFAL